MLALFGDSIAAGLGARGPSYGRLVADALGHDLIDFSGTALMVPESRDLAIESPRRADIALIGHGITEAIIRPVPEVLRFFPRRWRRLGWMDPRPYFSETWYRRVPQRVESAIRWRVRAGLIRRGPTYRLLPPDDYEHALRELTELLTARGTRVVLLGPPNLDGRFFPGSPESLHEYELVTKGTAALHGQTFLRLWNVCKAWSDYAADHFHLNDNGHERIAEAILDNLLSDQNNPKIHV